MPSTAKATPVERDALYFFCLALTAHCESTGRTFADIERIVKISGGYISNCCSSRATAPRMGEPTRRKIADAIGVDYLTMLTAGERIAERLEARKREALELQEIADLHRQVLEEEGGSVKTKDLLRWYDERLKACMQELEGYRKRFDDMVGIVLNPRRRGSR